MTAPVTFHVHGAPVQQGSTKGFVNKRSGRVQITHDNKAPLKSWRQDVAACAAEAGVVQLEGPVRVEATFRFVRPASVTAKKRPLPEVKPDLDKLARALLDALTGIAYRDDAQVVALDVQKLYADQPGLSCTIGHAVAMIVEPGAEPLPLEVPA